MRKFAACGIISLALFIIIGCRTTQDPKPVSWNRQSAYRASMRDPRLYGYGIYRTPTGVEFRGGSRLHPLQIESLSMAVKNPFRPVVGLRSRYGQEWPVLLDVSSEASWLNFSAAEKLGAVPVGEQEPLLVQRQGEDFPSSASVVPKLRFGQLQIESPLMYVRFANGSFGEAAREIEKPSIEGIVGWDIMTLFEQIRFDYQKGLLVLFSDTAYEPHPELLIARIPLSSAARVCAVRATVDGTPRMVLIDPAGDFEVANEDGSPVGFVMLDENLVFENPETSVSPGGFRIGARLLQNYSLILSPKTGFVSFERKE